MATEMTTGLDGCQEALMQRPWVNTVRTSQGKVPTHQHIRESDAALHKNPITQKHTYRRHENSTKRQEGAVVWASKRWWGRGMKKEERGREKKKKKLSSFRPSRPPVAFQPVSFTGLGKWSTAASLTYIVCIMLLLELPGRGEGCWTLICIELLSSLSQPAELSLSLLLSTASDLLELNKPSREAW